MPKIVNFSSCHTIYPIYSHYGIGAFADLRRKYHPDCCYFPLDFTKPIRNWAVVVYDYKHYEAALIEPYKRGEISTEQFFDDMLDIFDFLKRPENNNDTQEPLLGTKLLPFLVEDRQRVEENRAFLLTVRDKQGPLSHNDYAKALLEIAWTSRVEHREEDTLRCEDIFDTATEDDPVYIISNSNAPDVNKIVVQLMRANKEINWNQFVELLPDIDKGVDQNLAEKPFQDKLIQLAPGIYLCLSYKVGLYKTVEQNQEHIADNSTSSLIRALVDYIDSPQETQVISTWEPDLIEAINSGVLKENCYTHDDYFMVRQPSYGCRIS
ncbi:MAG: hypothetical protein K2Q33_04655 [Gammaproteobacteria bacterium]|nr:hypothetical protein [Gammaproteobacteria bacterium]